MSYNWNVDYIESRLDKNGDILGFGEIGGVGQLIYHNFRFADYKLKMDKRAGLLACPVCNKKSPPDLTPKDNLSGKEILTSLCELARRIDNVSEENDHRALIIGWCKENIHPYAIDYLYNVLVDNNFDIADINAELVAHGGIFSTEDFITDLEHLYNAARFYIALEAICFADNEPVYVMYQTGKHFQGLPYFERYKLNMEMPEGEFYTEPYDEYEKLREQLIDCIPDFKLRLKVNPQNNRLVFSADVNSVFDVAWYVLARMISEDPAPEDIGKEEERSEGIMICCHHCGRFFIRNVKHQQYCDRQECQKARNAKNQRDYRQRKAIEKAQQKHKKD